jgi:hypothetical protein
VTTTRLNPSVLDNTIVGPVGVLARSVLYPREISATIASMDAGRPRFPMLDFIFLLITFASFGVAAAYAHGCDRV